MEANDQRNLMLAILLVVVLYVGYSFFVIEPQQRAARAAAEARAKQVQTNPKPTTIDAPLLTRDQIVSGDKASNARVTVAAPSVDGSVSLAGGRIDDLRLRNYYETIDDKLAKRESGEIQLLAPEPTERSFYAEVQWVSPGGGSTRDAVWTRANAGDLTPDNPLQLSLALQSARIDRKISVDADFMFTIEDTVTNTGATPITLTPQAVIHQRSLPELLTTPRTEVQAHRGALGAYGGKTNQMLSYKDLNKGKAVQAPSDKGWIGLTTKYWMTAVIPQQGEPVTFYANADRKNAQTAFVAGYTGSARDIAPGSSANSTTRVFAGAKQVKVLDRYQQAGIPAFTDAVDWSWLFIITKPFFMLLQLFQGWFGSFGLAILALTVCVKAVFFPIQYKMYESMSKMRKLMPEQEEIRKRFAADPARVQQEVMKLYQREKVNPLAGCLPMIPQMFVFYALYHTLVVTIEMRHTPFYGWIKDMSAPDPTTIFNLFGLIPWDPTTLPMVGGFFAVYGLLHIGVWPILYGITMYLLQGLSPPPTDPTQKVIMRWMPAIFLILFASASAGLAIYWTWSNLITLTQQYIIMRRQGVETELDKFLKKRFGKPNPTNTPAE